MNEKIRIGIIGGSGLYNMEELSNVTTVTLDTPFGHPSDAYVVGTLGGVRVAFLPRHGQGHKLTPSEINFRANVYGFKQMGASHIISVTAVGSLKEDIHPLDIVIPDQFFDRTRNRKSTFFGDGLVAHIAFAQPICPDLASLLHETAVETGAKTHKGGILICIEGPAFSTRAESNLYRRWGMDIIGMTSLQEAKLSREAEICYAALALVTDYDCWHEDESEVTVETVLQNLNKNISHAKRIIQNIVPKIPEKRDCLCATALEKAIMTDANVIPKETRRKLGIIVNKYLPH
ncbi:MAG: S-methyl-5'-thioadenosine phosphorylase [Deltaproteobacteria bacterium]|nr:MAG: S-methyl-5'-thioadenosine phosphorylase [Deltaproteobacteria bacterium]RLC13324.1 MAG: S-methyl-5'-thioadenosine phosphorylase [Deltaproteobacteria bacterium]